MWIRFWTRVSDAASHGVPTADYQWFDKMPSKETLESQSRENADYQRYLNGEDVRVSHGYDAPTERLPPEVKAAMLKLAHDRKRAAESWIKHLEDKG